MKTVKHYEVIDRRANNQVIKIYACDKFRVASRYAHKKDSEYGACRYYVKPIYTNLSA